MRRNEQAFERKLKFTFRYAEMVKTLAEPSNNIDDVKKGREKKNTKCALKGKRKDSEKNLQS